MQIWPKERERVNFPLSTTTGQIFFSQFMKFKIESFIFFQPLINEKVVTILK